MSCHLKIRVTPEFKFYTFEVAYPFLSLGFETISQEYFRYNEHKIKILMQPKYGFFNTITFNEVKSCDLIFLVI